MPIMMEEGIDVDDLFGDPSSLELGLAPAPATKGLAQRLDELRLLGCYQKIAWSRLGAIAYISQDGNKVSVRYLLCMPNDGKWALSDGISVNQVSEAHGGHNLVHLSWSETGSELAIVDCSGRVSVFSISTALNILNLSRSALVDPDDDGAQVVGLLWLNINRAVHTFHNATRANGRWSYHAFRRRQLGPFHPTNKSALVCVTRSSHVRLLYQNPNNKWAEISTELRNIGSSDGVLTHAAMAPMEGSGILVATHSACGKICLYRIQVKWEPAQWDPTPKPGGQNNPFPTPSFQLLHIKTETPSTIFHPQGSTLEDPEGFSSPRNCLFCLTHLEIIPGSPGNPGGPSAAPCILGIFSQPVHASNDPLQQGSSSSVLVRWQFDSVVQTLHTSFDDVVSKKSNNQLKAKLELQRQADIYFDRFVVSVNHMEAGNVLAVTCDDSSISFFDARSMHPLSTLEDTSTVTSMSQAGFSFPIDTSGLHISFSPNGCLAIILDGEWQLHLRFMEHSFGAEDGLYDDGKFLCAVAALALGYARACCIECVSDDILMIVMRQLAADTQKAFITEVYQALPMNVDFMVEQDKLMNNQFIQKCLSMQAVLGFNTRYKPRGLAAAVPWVTLNLRHISILFVYFFHMTKTGKEAESYDPDVLRMILGNVKWVLDLAKYLIDDLFEIADNLENIPTDPNSLSQFVKNFETLSVILILSSAPRSFLRYICRGLRGLANGFNSAANLNGESLQLYSNIYSLIEHSPLKVDVYEKLLANVDSVVRHACQNAASGNADRATPERELLITSNIPPILQSAVVTILTQTITTIKPEVDRMELCLHDYSWLGVGDDKRTELFKRSHDVDVLKKVVIGPDLSQNKVPQSKRRCVRCCEVTEDITPVKSFPVFRMLGRIGVYRSCICGGMWVAMNPVDRVNGEPQPG